MERTYQTFELTLNRHKPEAKFASPVIDSQFLPITGFKDAYEIVPLQSSCSTAPSKLRREQYDKDAKSLLEKVQTILDFIEKSDMSSTTFEEDYGFVIGQDNRTKVVPPQIQDVPYRSIGKLEVIINKKRYRGTGAYIGNDKVLTAAHVVYDTVKDVPASYVRFIPQKHEASEPLGRFTGQGLLVSQLFKNDPKPNSTVDWAVVKVSGLAGKLCPLPLIGTLTPAHQVNINNLVEIAGYPSSKGNTMYTHQDVYNSLNYWRMSFLLDVTSGQSGSPLVVLNQQGNRYQAMGVLSEEVSSGSIKLNRGSRINHEDIQEIWKF